MFWNNRPVDLEGALLDKAGMLGLACECNLAGTVARGSMSVNNCLPNTQSFQHYHNIRINLFLTQIERQFLTKAMYSVLPNW